MRAISERKCDKVVKLYFDGVAYDEIVGIVGVSKGSVVNIIDELRDGAYPRFKDIADQVDFLRELAVDLRKLNISTWQARAGVSLFKRLLLLGVEPVDLERWIKLCHEITAPNDPGVLIATALELSVLEKEKGMSYEVAIEDYRAKLLQLQELEASIEGLQTQHAVEEEHHYEEMKRYQSEVETIRGTVAEMNKGYAQQRRIMEEEAKKYLTRHKLTMEQVELVTRLAGQKLLRSGLNKEAIDSLMKQLEEAGGLSALLPELESECNLLKANQAWLEMNNDTLNSGCSESLEKVETLRAEIAAQEGELTRLMWEVARAQERVRVLRGDGDKMKEDIDVANAVIGLIANPFMVMEVEFTALIKKILTHWSLLNEARRQFPIQEYRHPQPMEEVRQRLAELLEPLVSDKYVLRSEYAQCEEKLRRLEGG